MLTESSLDFDVHTQVTITTPALPGKSVFVQHYISAYCRRMPLGEIYEDVRDAASTALELCPLSAKDDAALPAVALHLFLGQLGKVFQVPKDSLAFPFPTGSFPGAKEMSVLAKELRSKLGDIEEDQLAASMEDLFLAKDKGIGAWNSDLRKRVADGTVIAKYFARIFEEPNAPARAGALLAVAQLAFPSYAKEPAGTLQLFYETLRSP